MLTRFRDGIVRQRAVTTSTAVAILTHGDRFLIPTAMVTGSYTVLCELNTIHTVKRQFRLVGRVRSPDAHRA